MTPAQLGRRNVTDVQRKEITGWFTIYERLRQERDRSQPPPGAPPAPGMPGS